MRNLDCAGVDGENESSISFTELDWDVVLSQRNIAQDVDFIIAADCTYNADSRSASQACIFFYSSDLYTAQRLFVPFSTWLRCRLTSQSS